MYIVAIAWMYITVLMAFTESSITAGVLTFIFYGLFPCALFIWIMGTPHRRRMKRQQEQQALMESQLHQPDRADTQRD